MKLETWRMAKPCIDCPFSNSGKGLFLRKTLRPKRWRSILAGLRRGHHFLCHNTTGATGDGTGRVCAGSIAWEDEHGLMSDLRQVAERVLASRKHPA